jgi:hypothetical protein
MILVRSGASRQRRRFTIAHELGHFLNPWHEPVTPTGFACSESDVGTAWRMPRPDSPRHWVQEAEASRFAIELLAPRRLMPPGTLRGTPDLEKVLDLARDLDISREACARRWLELHDEPIALVFGKEGTIRYVERSPAFPFVTSRKGSRLPALPCPADATGLSDHDEADWRDWLGKAPRGDLVVQALHQREGFTMALLVIDRAEDEEV